MKKQSWLRILSITTLLSVGLFALLFAFSPVSAAPAPVNSHGAQLQATPDAPNVQVTVVVPNTGGNTTTDNTGGFVSSWIVWVILGIIIIVLLAALLARGSGGPYPPA